MLGLATASLVSMRSTSAASSLECGGGTGGACCATILNTMPSKFEALKACFKQHISYSIQPRAQMSLLYEYGCMYDVAVVCNSTSRKEFNHH
jgi:hypothetical protein